MKFLSVLFLSFFTTIASATPYKLEGSFFADKDQKAPVSFNLEWTEKEDQIAGFYSDNHFAPRAPVRGLVTEYGRTFEILLPNDKRGVKSISLLTASVGAKKTGTSIPLQMVTRDERGNPLKTARLSVQFMDITPRSDTRQAEEERPCGEGLGDLAGYCGRYGGMIAEEFDSARMCDFMTPKDVRLELDNEANVIFHVSQPGDKHMSQDHLIGRVPSSAPSRTVDLMSRHCRPLPGTNFPGEDCKRLNLIGTFSMRNGEPHFTGTYSIINEKNDRSCRYSMTLDRVETI